MIFRFLPLACVVALLCPLAGAQAPSSRITAVTLYPGSVSVERTAHVAAGSRSVRFQCLPAGLDARNVQVTADAAVHVGDVTVQTQERLLQDACASPLDTRVREAQERLAAAQVETESLELAHTYLQSVAGSSVAGKTEDAKGQKTLPDSAHIQTNAQALRQAARDTLISLHQARQHQKNLEQALKALLAERDKSAAPRGRTATVTVTLAAERAGKVRLRYQVNGPSWSPGYRASLDSSKASVRLERLALVEQHTGEDWTDVPLRLSTGQPLAASQGALPRPWRIDVRPDVPARARALEQSQAVMQEMSAHRARSVSSLELDAPPPPVAAAPTPSFEVAMTQGAYATEFVVPQAISVPSGGQRVTLSLGEQTVPVRLLTRTAPHVSQSAWLVAQLPDLEGVWPAGDVTLYRDGALVGQGHFDPLDARAAREGLSFGRDERVIVSSEPQRQHTAHKGLTGATTERQIEQTWRVENRHDKAIELQVLAAAPISLDDKITIQSTYKPQPQNTAWEGQAGTLVWQQTLPAAGSIGFNARHTLRYAKDVQVRERR